MIVLGVVIVIPAGLQKGSQPAEWCVESSFCALGAQKSNSIRLIGLIAHFLLMLIYQSCLLAFLLLHAKNGGISICANAKRTRTLNLHKLKRVYFSRTPAVSVKTYLKRDLGA